MIVVSDTSPINYLILVGHVDVLPALFDEIVVPPAVFADLQDSGAPAAIQIFIRNPPSWFILRSPTNLDHGIKLGIGEVEAISLAVETRAAYLLADDQRARRAAVERGVTVAGTLAVLQLAAERNLIELHSAIDLLRQTNFYASEEVLARILAVDAERRSKDQP